MEERVVDLQPGFFDREVGFGLQVDLEPAAESFPVRIPAFGVERFGGGSSGP